MRLLSGDGNDGYSGAVSTGQPGGLRPLARSKLAGDNEVRPDTCWVSGSTAGASGGPSSSLTSVVQRGRKVGHTTEHRGGMPLERSCDNLNSRCSTDSASSEIKPGICLVATLTRIWFAAAQRTGYVMALVLAQVTSLLGMDEKSAIMIDDLIQDVVDGKYDSRQVDEMARDIYFSGLPKMALTRAAVLLVHIIMSNRREVSVLRLLSGMALLLTSLSMAWIGQMRANAWLEVGSVVHMLVRVGLQALSFSEYVLPGRCQPIWLLTVLEVVSHPTYEHVSDQVAVALHFFGMIAHAYCWHMRGIPNAPVIAFAVHSAALFSRMAYDEWLRKCALIRLKNEYGAVHSMPASSRQ